jgi:hypothetical protein
LNDFLDLKLTVVQWDWKGDREEMLFEVGGEVIQFGKQSLKFLQVMFVLMHSDMHSDVPSQTGMEEERYLACIQASYPKGCSKLKLWLAHDGI